MSELRGTPAGGLVGEGMKGVVAALTAMVRTQQVGPGSAGRSAAAVRNQRRGEWVLVHIRCHDVFFSFLCGWLLVESVISTGASIPRTEVSDHRL